LASGEDGHDVRAAAASRADKHIDGEQLVVLGGEFSSPTL
jgi:hypothetical protein